MKTKLPSALIFVLAQFVHSGVHASGLVTAWCGKINWQKDASMRFYGIMENS